MRHEKLVSEFREGSSIEREDVVRVIEYLETKGWAPAPEFSEKACASVRVYLRGKSEEEMRALFAADGAGIDLQLVGEMPTGTAVKWVIPALCGAVVETAKHVGSMYFAPLVGVAQGVLDVFTQLAKARRV